MCADDAREYPLLFLRKPGHIGVLEQIGAVLLVVRMRYIESDLVQARRPRQHQLGERLIQTPCSLGLAQKIQRSRLDALGLREIDVIARLHRPYAQHARVLVREASDQVVEQPFAQRAVRNSHRLDLEYAENLREDRESAENTGTRSSVSPGKPQFRQRAGPDRVLDRVTRRPASGDRRLRAVPRAQDIPDGANRSGRPHCVVPAEVLNVACTGSSSRRAAIRARFMRLSVISPSAKNRALMLTQPI